MELQNNSMDLINDAKMNSTESQKFNEVRRKIQ